MPNHSPRQTAQKTKQPSDRIWDELQDMYRECAAYMLSTMSIQQLLSNAEHSSKVKDQESLRKNATLFLRDVRTFNETLQGIYEQHKNRVGSVNNSQDLMTAVQTGERYIDWTQSFESVVFPTMRAIQELYAAAEGPNVPESILLEMKEFVPPATHEDNA